MAGEGLREREGEVEREKGGSETAVVLRGEEVGREGREEVVEGGGGGGERRGREGEEDGDA